MYNYCLRSQTLKNSLKTLNITYKETFHILVRNVSNIRNIGILAHIDAGKTTTTERMLYYSGSIAHMGEVHHGNTVTDYMIQERNRGITITSASVTIPWLNHRINIIDTPGHIDFTVEVEQSLNVIDSVVIILDASAGVEAQTVTVWKQTDRQQIPRIVYANKMDRSDSSFALCLNSLKSKFRVRTLPLQVPIRGKSKGLTGVIDLVTSELLSWDGEQGERIMKRTIKEADTALWKELENGRNKLIDELAELDDVFLETVLKEESMENVPSSSMKEAIRRVTIAQKGVPVICGSSYKNIGVQKLMDCVVDYLPSPKDSKDYNVYKAFGNSFCGRAFKIVHDKQKGPITFVRVYSGFATKNQRIYNVRREFTEQSQKVFEAYADDYKEVENVTAGNIAAITGLKKTYSGDVICSGNTAVKNAVRDLAKRRKISEDESFNLICPPLNNMDAVFFCSIEAPSQSYQNALDNALEQLKREDAGLKIEQNPDTGQTVLGGMGELHLEIIKDRILTDYKIEAYVGPLQIAYKENIISEATYKLSHCIAVGSSKHNVTISMSVFPQTDDTKNELITMDKTPENVGNTSSISIRKLNAIRNGIESALSSGPKIGCPVTNASFMIHNMLVTRGTSDTVISSATAQCVQTLLRLSGSVLCEPIMMLEIISDNRNMTKVNADLGRRRAEILEFTSRGEAEILRALVPLSELLGYSKDLRILTSGCAYFTMEFNSYRRLEAAEEKEAIKNITGFY